MVLWEILEPLSIIFGGRFFGTSGDASRSPNGKVSGGDISGRRVVNHQPKQCSKPDIPPVKFQGTQYSSPVFSSVTHEA